MFALTFYRRCLAFYLLTASSITFSLPVNDPNTLRPLGNIRQNLIVEHIDQITIDKSLSLAKVIDLTLEKYPDNTWLEALEEEASAISERGQSWTAGSSLASAGFQTLYSAKLRWFTAGVQVPLWNWGQREAEQKLANKAEISAEQQSTAIKLQIAGLVRVTLWDMALATVRYEHAKAVLGIYEQLLSSIKRQVQLGDLPRSDELLAKTELLQKRSEYTKIEAELMHSRRRYMTITQMVKAPAIFDENMAALNEIAQNHPAVASINSQIERKKAELDAVKLIGSGQSHVIAGLLSDEGHDPRSNHGEFFNVGVNIPFGGSAHLAPQVAAKNVELNKLITQRDQLYRNLGQAHHEAEHNLEVDKEELKIAKEIKQTAEKHLKMMELSFSVGEINLMDLLRIKSSTEQAVLNAKERAVMLQRDIAFYNQAVGVMP